MERNAWLALALSLAFNLGLVVPWLNRLARPQGPAEPPPRGRVELRLAPRPAPPRPTLPLPRPRTTPGPVSRPGPAPPPRLLATPPPPPPPPPSYPTAAPRRPRPHPTRSATPRAVSTAAPPPLPEPVPASPPPAPAPAPAPVAATTPGGDRRARRLLSPDPPVPPGLTVRVRFEIAASGQARPRLLDGTGDPVQDDLILAVLRKWTWEPALSDGQPVDAVEVFRLSGGEGAAQ